MDELPSGETIFYEVIDLVDPAAEPFCVVRIDTEKKAGNGVEGVVQSLHWNRAEAVMAAAQMQMGERAGLN